MPALERSRIPRRLALDVPAAVGKVVKYPALGALTTVLIVALMGAGLKIDRPFGWAAWRPTWRLLGVAMPLTIVATGVLGWVVVGLAPAAAMLLGAVVAPTDPVLATRELRGGHRPQGPHGRLPGPARRRDPLSSHHVGALNSSCASKTSSRMSRSSSPSSWTTVTSPVVSSTT